MRPSSQFDGSHLGKYRLIERIGSGGMAEVYSARHEGEGGFTKDLVIKMILPGFAEQPKFIELFLNEAKLAAQLSHPNIVQIFDFGSQNGRYFLVMEFVRGLTLRKIKNLSAAAREPIPVRIAARIMCGAAQGLHYAHELADESGAPLGIIHRDLSPDNMIVSEDGIPKLLDFGIAKATNAASATTEGNLKGKYPYMSPELVLGDKVDRRMDIYALGVNLYEIITGKKPFLADDTQVFKLLTQITEEPAPALAASRADIPDGLEQIVSKAMAKKPEDRFATAREMHVALETFLSKTGEAVLEFHTAEYIKGLVEHTGGTDSAFTSAFDTPYSGLADQPVKTPAPPATPEPPAPPAPTVLNLPSFDGSIKPRRFPWVLALVTLVAVAGAAGLYYAQSTEGGSAVAKAPTTTPNDPIQEPTIAPAYDAAVAKVPELVMGNVTDLEPLETPPDAGVVPLDASRDETLVVKVPVKPKLPKEPKPPKEVKGSASLTVRSSPYCTLYIDSKRVGDTPISSHKVKAGKHQLRCVNKEQGLERKTTVTLSAGEKKSETFRFNKGKLVIRVKPWGEVWVDGKRKGVTPFGPVTVYEGSHKIKAVNKDLKTSRTVRMRVGSGETKQVKIDLTK